MAMQTAARPTRSSRDERRERRREELLDAADRVIRRGTPDVSMDGIAAEAGITKPVLYRHFGDKEGLYEALCERYVGELRHELRPARAATAGARARLAATIDGYLAYVEREPNRYRFLLQAAERPRTSPLVAEFRRGLAMECAGATVERLRSAGLDAEMAEPWAHCVAGTIRAAGAWWLETRSVSRLRLVEYLTAFIWEGASALRRA